MRLLVDRFLGSFRVRAAYQRLKSARVVGPALRWAVRLAFPPAQPRWVEIPRGLGKGLVLLVDPRYELAYVRGDHEPWVQDLVASWLRHGDVFYDVGAHVGFFSVLAGRLVRPGGAVIAFEPDPDNFARLEANIARNRMGCVRPVCAVVLDRSGTVSFARAPAASSRVEGRAVGSDGALATEVLSVPGVTLDDHYDPRPGVVKIDVEGGELQVLSGARRLLAEGKLGWIVEAHSEELEAALVRIFNNAGYTVRAMRPTHQSYPEYRQRYVLATIRSELSSSGG